MLTDTDLLWYLDNRSSLSGNENGRTTILGQCIHDVVFTKLTGLKAKKSVLLSKGSTVVLSGHIFMNTVQSL